MDEPSSHTAAPLAAPSLAVPTITDPSVFEATGSGRRKLSPKLLRVRKPVSNDHAKPAGSESTPRDGSRSKPPKIVDPSAETPLAVAFASTPRPVMNWRPVSGVQY